MKQLLYIVYPWGTLIQSVDADECKDIMSYDHKEAVVLTQSEMVDEL